MNFEAYFAFFFFTILGVGVLGVIAVIIMAWQDSRVQTIEEKLADPPEEKAPIPHE